MRTKGKQMLKLNKVKEAWEMIVITPRIFLDVKLLSLRYGFCAVSSVTRKKKHASQHNLRKSKKATKQDRDALGVKYSFTADIGL